MVMEIIIQCLSYPTVPIAIFTIHLCIEGDHLMIGILLNTPKAPFHFIGVRSASDRKLETDVQPPPPEME